jgi:hypothetical protein
VSFDKVVEQIIQDAMARGEFDNLPGKGKPLNHDAYFALPEDVRLGYAVLKNTGFVPEEVELLREINELKAQLAEGGDDERRGRLKAAINVKTLKLNLLTERYRRRSKRPSP